MDFAMQVLNKNKNTIALNCVKFALWYEKTPTETMENSYKNMIENNLYIDRSLFFDTIFNVLHDMTTKNGFTKIVNNERKTIVYPVCKNTKEYIKMFMESEKTIDEMTDFIKNIL